MKLLHDQFDESGAGSESSLARQRFSDERRAHPRMAIRAEVQLLVRLNARVYRAEPLDLSSGGIGFLAESWLPEGTRVMIELEPGPGLSTPITKSGAVRACAPARLGAWRVGLAFDSADASLVGFAAD